MPAILLDTHAWVWSFADDGALSDTAREAILRAEAVYVSPISFFEIGQKVRTGKWPEMAAEAEALPQLLHDQGGLAAPLTPAICLQAALWDWPHRDPFDRLIGASARAMGCPLVTRDAALSAQTEIQTLW